MIHELKTVQPYFDDVISGKKAFEIRKYDRPFEVGDLLALNEYDAENQCYTGNSCVVYIDYMLDNAEYCKVGYVVLGIKPCAVWQVKKPRSEVTFDYDYSVPFATRAKREGAKE